MKGRGWELLALGQHLLNQGDQDELRGAKGGEGCVRAVGADKTVLRDVTEEEGSVGASNDELRGVKGGEGCVGAVGAERTVLREALVRERSVRAETAVIRDGHVGEESIGPGSTVLDGEEGRVNAKIAVIREVSVGEEGVRSSSTVLRDGGEGCGGAGGADRTVSRDGTVEEESAIPNKTRKLPRMKTGSDRKSRKGKRT